MDCVNELVKHVQNLLGFRLSAWQVNAFCKYEHELLSWNDRVNLTAVREPEQIRIKHFLDSLTCLQVIREAQAVKLIDVGTGAGFPGLPMKIVNPNLQLTLVESVGKKTNFCQHMVRTLGLEGVKVVQERVETLGQMNEHRQRYDWATARAVAVMPILVEYLLPLVKVGGGVVAMKGENAPAETQTSEHAIRLLGGHLRKTHPGDLTGRRRRALSGNH